MNIQAFLILYAVSVPVFFLIDMLWLGVVAKSFYQNRIGHLMEVSWLPAIIFYLIFLIGLTIFATYPALSVSSGLKYAFVYGALFGFFTYLTYDMTNLATLKDWPISMVVVDIIWGTVLGSSVAGLSYYLYTLI